MSTAARRLKLNEEERNVLVQALQSALNLLTMATISGASAREEHRDKLTRKVEIMQGLLARLRPEDGT